MAVPEAIRFAKGVFGNARARQGARLPPGRHQRALSQAVSLRVATTPRQHESSGDAAGNDRKAAPISFRDGIGIELLRGDNVVRQERVFGSGSRPSTLVRPRSLTQRRGDAARCVAGPHTTESAASLCPPGECLQREFDRVRRRRAQGCLPNCPRSTAQK